MDNLERYAEQLKASISEFERTIETLNGFLVLHEKYGITDPLGEQNLRDDLVQQATFLDRYRTRR